MKLVAEISSAGNNARNSTWKTWWKKRQLVEFHRTRLTHDVVVTICPSWRRSFEPVPGITRFSAAGDSPRSLLAFSSSLEMFGATYRGTLCAVTVDNAVKNKSSVRGVPSYRGLENENEFTKPSTFHSVIPSPPSFS